MKTTKSNSSPLSLFKVTCLAFTHLKEKNNYYNGDEASWINKKKDWKRAKLIVNIAPKKKKSYSEHRH